LSRIFDARKHAEQAKRAREAIAATPQLPNSKPESSVLQDPGPTTQKAALEPNSPGQPNGTEVQLAASGASEGSPSSLLGLKVERRATDWRLRWNRSAAITATRGNLTITDGAIHKQLDLDVAELQTGSIVYTPATDDACIRLEIVTPESENPITESVRLVAATTSLFPRQAEANGAAPVGAARIARSDGAWATRVETSQDAVPRKAPIVRSLLRVPRFTRFSAAPPVPDAEPKNGRIEPATLISRTEPVYPVNATPGPISETVEVHFRISPEGRTYDVRSANGSPVLAQAAVEAVEAWCYEPARLNGAPVDSEATTNFNFEMN
jgi:periplasmic protein TonB